MKNILNGEDDSVGSYVDLELPSGTQWSSSNEVNVNAIHDEFDFFTFNEAISKFGNRLPSNAQWAELKAECSWLWNGNGYKVTGSNGNFIVLPASGFRRCDNGSFHTSHRFHGLCSINLVGDDGCYWSSTPYEDRGAWVFYFQSSDHCDVNPFKYHEYYGFSVRLVKKNYRARRAAAIKKHENGLKASRIYLSIS